MSEINRRDFSVSAAAIALLGMAQAHAQNQNQNQAAKPAPASDASPGAGGGTLGASKVFAPALAKMPNGTQRWMTLDGTLATGEALSMHESVVPAGTPKSAAHVIKHSEVIIVVEGTLAFQHDGVVEHAAAGSVMYVAYGTNHLVWNAGTDQARYFVLQIGGDTKKA